MWFQRINNFKVLAGAVLLAAASGGAFSQKISKEGIVSEGKNRSYYIYSPASLKPSSPAPLLVLLHGSGSNGSSPLEHWKNLADREGIILVGPDSLDLSRWRKVIG
jgi:poly(3-hydroxybutyrate) depolymerase